MLTSALCTNAQLQSPTFRHWIAECNLALFTQRKFWEIAFIAQALEERGFLKPGVRGLGFAVGTEPLAALFAKYGCEVVATDLGDGGPNEHRLEAWKSSAEHADGLGQLNHRVVCPEPAFRQRVSFEFVDMNAIPGHLKGFDFCWSCGSVEHVGDLELSKKALAAMTACCRPGGLSVHTTELDLLSRDESFTAGSTVFYRPRDIDDCAARLRRAGHRLLPVDGAVGDDDEDHHVDVRPYLSDGKPHLKLYFQGHTITSIGLVIEAGVVPESERAAPPGPAWFNDAFFRPEGRAARQRLEDGNEIKRLGERVDRLSALVTELRELAPDRLPTPSYRYPDPADFARVARAGAGFVALGDGTGVAQVFADTHLFVPLGRPESAELVTGGAADLPASVSIARQVRAGATALDIGAGYGYHAALMARLVGPGGRVIASEPDPALAALLARGVRANGFAHVEAHALRVSDGTGVGECCVEELLRGRRLDFARVGDPAQLEAAWAGLAAARFANPQLVVLLTLHPGGMADAGAFLERVRADHYVLSLIGPGGEVLAVPELAGAFGADSPPWLLFGVRARVTPGAGAIE